MIEVPNPVFRAAKLKTLILCLALIFIVKNIRAQSNLEPHFRVITYLPHTINGFAPEGSIIKLYYADSGSFTPNTTEPFKTIVTGPAPFFVWVYSRASDNLGDFDGPVVASMTRPGSAEQIFETADLGSDEVGILDPRPCAETQALTMRPTVNDMFTWRDERGNIKGHDKLLPGVPPGTYTLEYTNIAGRFYRSGVPVVVDGPPHAVSDGVTMLCGESFADYKGVYSGTAASFLWENQADGAQVGTTQRVSLTPGKYNFYAISPGGCRSAPATVTVNAAPVLAGIDTSRKQVEKTLCNQATGSITGIRVFATDNNTPSYRWKDTNGHTFNDIDLHNLPAGKYTLEAYIIGNDCPTFLTEVEIKEENGITLDDDPQIPQTQPSCGLNNGSITGLSSTNATIFEWFKGEDRTTPVSTGLELHNASPGFYTLILRNEFGCRHEYLAHFFEISPAVELTSIPVIKNDNCNLGKGSITGVRFNTPVTYYWQNEAGEELARNGDLLNVPAGNYTLFAKNDKCRGSTPFTIGNSESVITPPVMDDILVCAASDVNVSFVEASDIYRIYDASGTRIAQGSSKNFKIRVDQPGVYYAALASGSCESSRTMFNIAFGASGLKIPNVFSPNGDGINDKWIIKGLDVYTRPEVKLFNRQGQLVFHSIGHTDLFDGKSKGKDLPVGVYYYIVSASPDCDPASGSLSLIR